RSSGGHWPSSGRRGAGGSVAVEHLAERLPPRARLTVGERLLHRVGQLPPALRLGVGGHRRHVGREVLADVVERGEQILAVAPDRVVPDVREADLVENTPPRRGVKALVRLDRLGLDPDPLAEPPKGHVSGPPPRPPTQWPPPRTRPRSPR